MMKKRKIVFLPAKKWLIKELWEPKAKYLAQSSNFNIEVHVQEELNELQLKKVLRDCEGLITSWGSRACTATFVNEYMPKVKIIGHAAGSVVSITDESTYTTGVKVITANQIMAQGVAEWSLLATLLAARNFGAYAGLYGLNKMNFSQSHKMLDIQNLTVGLWGFGDTSKHLLKMLAPLNPGRIIIASEHSTASEIAQFGAEKQDIETVLREADIFHALVGLNSHNFERLSKNEFALMKPASTFINCGRSRLVREKDLLEALAAKRISAILDVFAVEPLPDNSPYYKLTNVILTPHNAGLPGRERFIPFLMNEFEKFFAGHKIHSGVSKNRFLSMTNEALVWNRTGVCNV
jgi:phosphoglycerate dehydrogenase-like enzyme